MDEQQDILGKLEKVAAPVIEGEGLELYDIEYKRESTGWVVRFYIWHDDGVKIEDCVRVSKQLNILLDVEDIIKHPYNLEVSSPGMNRHLKKNRHFEKAIGSMVKIKTIDFIDNRKTFKGLITKLENGVVVIDEGTRTVNVPLNNISSAKLEIEF